MLLLAVVTVRHTHRVLLKRYGALAVVLAHGCMVCVTSATHAFLRLPTQAWWRHSRMCMHGARLS